MRHNRGTQDTGAKQDTFGIGEVRDKSAMGDCSPVRMAEEHFDHVTDGDDGEEAGDDRFQRAEAIAFQSKDEEGDDSGQKACDPERKTKEEVERHSRAQELSQVGGHGDQFHQNPHGPNDRTREMRAAVLGQVLAGGDAEFGRESLQEHGHQVAAPE